MHTAPGEIDYVVEARVRYNKDGNLQDAWIRASEVFTSHAEIEFWLSQKKSKLCIVRWNPRNPSLIRAVLS